MDPLTALSLAASVVAFVDFASKILKTSNEIRKDGTSIESGHLIKTSKDLVALSAGLRVHRRSDTALAQDEQALDAIALECAKIADHLVRTLSKLATNGDGKGKGWESIQVAFKTIWLKGEIEDLVKRLDQYRQELALRLLVVLNKKVDLQSADNCERLSDLEASNQKIVEIVTFTQSLWEKVLPSENDGPMQGHQQEYVTGSQHPTKDAGQTRRQQVNSAILTLSDGTTLSHLKDWAGSYPLACASFFFWSHGTSLQKTQEGLIRGLLSDLLEQCPYLIPDVFPDLCMEMIKTRTQMQDEITAEELRIAFRRFVDKAEQRVKVCLFIDGLDEYLGDHVGLCNFFFEIMKASESLKILFSSRPWNVFINTFSRQPSLQMQDLTRPDIRLFASQELKNSPGALHILIDSLCEKASGVFLWVALAVRSLSRGIMDGNGVESLMESLNQLPADLEQIYRHMFESLDGIQEGRAARMILMLLRGETIQTDDPVSLLQMALAEDVNLKQAIDAPIRAMPPLERQSRCDLMRRRLQGSTHGLLEVVGKNDGFLGSSSSMNSYVAFFHRTAADYFERSDMWNLLSSLAGRAFDPDLTLLAACLHEMKTLPMQRAIVMDSDRLMVNAPQIFVYTRSLEIKHRRPKSVVLDELKRVCDRHWEEATDYKQRDTDLTWCSTQGGYWALNLMPLRWRQRTARRHMTLEIDTTTLFLSLSIYLRCVLYVHDKVRLNSKMSKQDQVDLLGGLVVDFWRIIIAQEEDDLIYNYISAISGLLELGTDPNMKAGALESQLSPWITFLRSVKVANREENSGHTYFKTMRLVNEQLTVYHSFILAGAHVDVAFESQGMTFSPLSVLEELKEVVKMCNGTLQEKNEFKSKHAAICELMAEGSLQRHVQEREVENHRSFRLGVKKLKNYLRLSFRGSKEGD